MAIVDCRSVILTLQDLTEKRWVSAMADAGLNTLLLHAVRLPQDITALIHLRNSDPGRELADACHSHGIQVEYQMHTATWLLPRMLFRQQPELFRADLWGNRISDCNFCFSSEEAWDIVRERLTTLVTTLRSDTARYLLFADDVGEGSCHCPACAALSASDQALLYANRLCQGIRETQPAAQVSYLAYHATLSPPEQVEPADGVFLEFAPIRRCYRHAIDDAGCAVNRRHAQSLRESAALFRQAPIHITEYWLDASRHSGWRRPAGKIPVSVDIMRRDIDFYVSQGATSIATYAVMCDEEYWAAYGPPPLAEYGQALVR